MYRSLINFIYDVITEMEEFTEEKLILFVQEYTNLYDLGNTNYHNSLIPVSYTHLDVYKRQV